MKEVQERLQKRKSGPGQAPPPSLVSSGSQETCPGREDALQALKLAAVSLGGGAAAKPTGKIAGFLHSMQGETAKSKITQKFDRLHEKQRYQRGYTTNSPGAVPH